MSEEITCITLVRKTDGNKILGKTAWKDKETGKRQRSSAGCRMSKGRAKVVPLDPEKPFAHLAETIANLTSDRSVVHGIPKASAGLNGHPFQIRTQAAITRGAKGIPRTKDMWTYGGTILFDHDPSDKSPVKGWDEFYTAIGKVFPEWLDAGYVVIPSASSFIYDTDSEEYWTKLRGFHHYAIAKNPADIKRFMTALGERLWLAGYGFYAISKDGRLLERTIFDAAVTSPERLDFMGETSCSNGLEVRRPENSVKINEAALLDTELLPDLSDSERAEYEKLKAIAKKEGTAEAKIIRAAWKKTEVEQLTKRGVAYDKAQQIVDSRGRGILEASDYIVIDRDNGTTVQVRDILLNPEQYNNATCPDPVEPEYGGIGGGYGFGKAMIYANLDTGCPAIHSYAHGGRDYELLHDYESLKARFEHLYTDIFGEADDLGGTWAALLAKAVVTPTEEDRIKSWLSKTLGVGKAAINRELKQAKEKTKAKPTYDADSVEELTEEEFRLQEYAAEYNETMAVVKLETQTLFLLMEKDKAGYYVPRLMKYADLRLWKKKDWVKINDEKVYAFDYWTSWESRREYKQLRFDPAPNTYDDPDAPILPDGDTFNLWRGLALRGKAGDCSRIRKHLLEVWAGGDEKAYAYILRWIAFSIRNPQKLCEVVLAILGKQGTGKNIIYAGVLNPIFGRHSIMVSSMDQIIGRFNSHLAVSVFVLANEATWGGNKASKGLLKALITDETRMLEQKYKDAVEVNNHVKLLVFSNEDWALPVEFGDRRACVLTPSDKYVGNRDYFKKLQYEIEHGGREAFLHEMLEMDLSDFEIRDLPEKGVSTRLDMQLKDAPDYMGWVYDLLARGEEWVRGGDDFCGVAVEKWIDDEGEEVTKKIDWEKHSPVIRTETLHDDYLAYRDKHGIRVPRAVVSSELIRAIRGKLGQEFMSGIRPAKDPRPRCQVLLPLSEARATFDERLKTSGKWNEGEVDEGE